MRTLLTLTLLAVVVPAAAAGGGFSTVGVGPPPAGLGPGDTWRAELTIRAHGVTPVDGLSPTLTIRGPRTETFAAKPAGKPGLYVADVVFPVAGSYRYEVMDGYAGAVHTFAPYQVGPPAPGGQAFPAWAIAPIVAAGVAAALAAFLLRRRTLRAVTATG